MGNKRTKKVRRSAGTDKKTMSKGNGHINPNEMLLSDWLKIFKLLLGLFGHFYRFSNLLNTMAMPKWVFFLENSAIKCIFDQFQCKKLDWKWLPIKIRLPQLLRVNKYMKPLMITFIGSWTGHFMILRTKWTN